MVYDYSLGIMGNIQKLYDEGNATNINLGLEVALQAQNKIESERLITELDIANIVAEQSITDLDLRVLELESKGV